MMGVDTPPRPSATTPPPAVTVIIPTYNRLNYLKESLQSVLTQRYHDFDVIVVDDGSTDDTAAFLNEISDPRLRVIRQANRGISAALNAGIRAARGACIARLDSDDMWLPNALVRLVDTLDAHPDADVAFGRAHAVVGLTGRVDHVRGLPPRFGDDMCRSLLYEDCTCSVALLARRACFERAGLYDESLSANEDWDMWLRVARDHRFVFVDEVLALIRLHDSNLTGLNSVRLAEVLESRTIPLDKFFRQPGLPAALTAMRPVAYANVHLSAGVRWLQAREWPRALTAFRRAVAVSDRPATTAMRILWFAAVVPVLRRVRYGRHAEVGRPGPSA